MRAELIRPTVRSTLPTARAPSASVKLRLPRVEPLVVVGGGILATWAGLAFLVLREFAGLHALFH